MIGRTAKRVSKADAMAHVAGYVVLNDVSARDWQGVPAALRDGEKGDGQWLRAKSSDTFLPMGPVFVTADELDPAAGLRLRSWRITPDGTEHLMQDGTTADMIWDVPALIEFISAVHHAGAGRRDRDGHARRASACSATRRSSSSRVTVSAARSRASAASRTRWSTGRRSTPPRLDRARPVPCASAHHASRYAPCMQALVKTAPGPGLELLDVPEPSMTINDVRIRVHKTGICGTDLHIADWDAWAQKTIKPPLIVGHEFVGEVLEVGSNVHDIAPGDIVSGEGHVVCGRCRHCRAGRWHLCANTIGPRRPARRGVRRAGRPAR